MPTSWTWTMLVCPAWPTGNPAVITTRSPDLTSPAAVAAPKARWIISSEVVNRSVRNGITPHVKASLRYVGSTQVTAMIGTAGRWRATVRAVCPDSVGVIIARAPTLAAISTVVPSSERTRPGTGQAG